jgi:predicted nuclease of restriction endonuclease-like (RecB) superfamily
MEGGAIGSRLERQISTVFAIRNRENIDEKQVIFDICQIPRKKTRSKANWALTQIHNQIHANVGERTTLCSDHSALLESSKE